ncbi:MAG TPA: sulfatase-like hydrolase/transferase, partial [Planctomycetota bacterium]|nr:sulfatase-like hydrolase/transferase [Planctomycetota bacterium]
MKLTHFLALVAVLALAPAPQDRPPNIIFILADDLGYGELGSYGQTKIRTPVLDRMAAEGMRFTDFYCGNAVCAPSRCVLMTGKHAGHAYVRDNREVLPEGQVPIPADAVTIAELLKAKGYATAAIGKWGLGAPGSTGDPNRHGFDLYYG